MMANAMHPVTESCRKPPLCRVDELTPPVAEFLVFDTCMRDFGPRNLLVPCPLVDGGPKCLAAGNNTCHLAAARHSPLSSWWP